MKKLFMVITALAIVQCTISQTQNNITSEDKLDIKINKNIELLGLAYFIGFEGVDIENKTVKIQGETIPKKEWHNYGYQLYLKYKPFATSNNLEKSFSVANHLWLDYLTAFLLQVGDVPNAELSPEIDKGYYLNFSKSKDSIAARKNAEIFLEGLNAFAKEIDLEDYLTDSKVYYESAIQEIADGLLDNNFIVSMEKFYGESFDQYVLVPSLTIPKGMGFGIKILRDTNTSVFSVFGALGIQDFDDEDNLEMGFAYEKELMELSIHEFGHSFVNPVVAQLPDSLFTSTEHLFEPLRKKMEAQGYNTWKSCVYEHFVRAGEILIAEKLGNLDAAERLRLDYLERRKFNHIPLIIKELKVYDSGVYSSYCETVERAMIALSKI
ncbi:DUF4932 domain-containing protein [Winogradskyella maritima]|uniref:DUF4932 domain-containing protein n=1 Tax=Winogradskyella maritima TaxID=1517766 RepID=A0ABV8AGV0_9FLAO|nr:DUF4932 domain-containing protein [Winogradskyella maritima]